MDNKTHVNKLITEPDFLRKTLESLGVDIFTFDNRRKTPKRRSLLAFESEIDLAIFFDNSNFEKMNNLVFPYKESTSLKSLFTAIDFFNKIFYRIKHNNKKSFFKVTIYKNALVFNYRQFGFRYSIGTGATYIQLGNYYFRSSEYFSGFGIDVIYTSLLYFFKDSFSNYLESDKIVVNSKIFEFVLNESYFDYIDRKYDNCDFNIISNSEFIKNISLCNNLKLYGKNDGSLNYKQSKDVIYFYTRNYKDSLAGKKFLKFDFIKDESTTNIIVRDDNKNAIKSMLKGVLDNENMSLFLNIISLSKFLEKIMPHHHHIAFKNFNSKFFNITKTNFSQELLSSNIVCYSFYFGLFQLEIKKNISLSYYHPTKIVDSIDSDGGQRISVSVNLKVIYNDLFTVVSNYITSCLSLEKELIRNEHIEILEIINA